MNGDRLSSVATNKIKRIKNAIKIGFKMTFDTIKLVWLARLLC